MTKKEQMIQMREQGLRCKDIADALDCTTQYVSAVCGKCVPSYFRPIGDECIYPNLRKWMNENKVSRMEFLRRMGIMAANPSNYERFNMYILGKSNPKKTCIDKMLKVTGLTYETLFAVEGEYVKRKTAD